MVLNIILGLVQRLVQPSGKEHRDTVYKTKGSSQSLNPLTFSVRSPRATSSDAQLQGMAFRPQGLLSSKGIKFPRSRHLDAEAIGAVI